MLMDISSSWPGLGAELKRQDPGRPARTHAPSHRVYVCRVSLSPAHSAAALAPGEAPPTAQQCLSRPGLRRELGLWVFTKELSPLPCPGGTRAPAGCLAASGGPTRSRKQEPRARSPVPPPHCSQILAKFPLGVHLSRPGPGSKSGHADLHRPELRPLARTVTTVPGCLVL